MPLIEDVKRVCDRLAPFGWRDLLLAHGLDITATNLKQELTKELPNINRNISGFEVYRPGNSFPSPDNFRKQLVGIQETVTLFVTPLNILLKRGNGAWSRRRV